MSSASYRGFRNSTHKKKKVDIAFYGRGASGGGAEENDVRKFAPQSLGEKPCGDSRDGSFEVINGEVALSYYLANTFSDGLASTYVEPFRNKLV